MAFENDRRLPDGDDGAPAPSDGDHSPGDGGSAEAWGGGASTDNNRFDLGFDDALPGAAGSPEEERSRVDGMPEGWLEGPGDAAAVVDAGPDGLAVTTPDDDPEASGVSHSSRVQIGTGQSGIVSPGDISSAAGRAEERSVRTLGQDPEAEDSGSWSGKGAATTEEPRSGDEKAADEWRDIIATVRDDVPSESIGFGAFVGGADVVDPAMADSYHGDSQGIEESHGESIDVAALGSSLPSLVPSGAIVPSGPRSKKPGGGLGQVVGVVIGGMLAIPVTLAILLYGFQRDPLQLTANVPDGLRFLLPSRFQPVGIDRRNDQRSPGAGGLTLDQLPSPPVTAVVAGDTPDPHVSPVPATPGSVEKSVEGEPVPAPVEPIESGVSRLPASPPPHPVDEVEIVVDPVLVEAGATSGDSGREAAGIDLGPVSAAIDAAAIATDHLGAGEAGGDPAAREPALVGWYRSLSLVAMELAKVERATIESGRPSSEVVSGFTALRARLASERHDDLELLGSMWLSSEKRPSDGAILVATLESARPVGPWWGGRLSVGGEAPRGLSFLARSAPTARPGEAVIVVGVLGDPGTIWAVDIGTLPVAEKASGEALAPPSL